MQRIRIALGFLLGILAVPTAAWPQAPQTDARPEILVLGTFHMANPGHDIHNLPADDVFAPQRQREIAQLTEVLQRFRPTKIAVEGDVGDRRVGQRYAAYLAGTYPLSRGEGEQVGFRLAKALGHRTVYPVDEGGDFPYYRVRNYAVANGRAAEFAAVEARTGARVRAFGDYLRGHTVLETLAYINADSMVARDVAEYFAYVPLGEPYEYAGPDLLAAWYQRNIRIYHNVRALAAAPGDRVLVIYGYGHLGWLRQDAANDATVRLRKLSEFTGP